MISEFGGDFLQWLRGFYYTAREGTVSRAGELIGRGQSTVTHQIKNLEEELEVQLFDRIYGRLLLTNEGKKLLEKTIDIFEIIKEIKEYFNQDNKDLLMDNICIVTTHSMFNYMLPKIISDFCSLYPSIHFSLKTGGTNLAIELVGLAEVDFGIISTPCSTQHCLQFEPIFENNLALISSIKESWPCKGIPTLKQIAQKPFVCAPESHGIFNLIDGKFKSEGLMLNYILELEDYTLVKKFVQAGMGVSIIDDFTISKHDTLSLNKFSLENIFPKRTWNIATRRRGYLSPAARLFKRFILAANLFKRK